MVELAEPRNRAIAPVNDRARSVGGKRPHELERLGFGLRHGGFACVGDGCGEAARFRADGARQKLCHRERGERHDGEADQ